MRTIKFSNLIAKLRNKKIKILIIVQFLSPF